MQMPSKEVRQILFGVLDDGVGGTPFTCRRKIDKSGWELVRATNPDWRDVVGDFELVAEFADGFEAKLRCREMAAQWVFDAILVATGKAE